MTSLVLPLLVSLSAAQVSAEITERPHLFGTVRITPMTAYPDVASGSVTVHAIPYVDLEAGAGFGPSISTLYVRGGPRFVVKDFRKADQHGWTMRFALLAGYKSISTWSPEAFTGLNTVAAADWTYWFGPHTGLTMGVTGGATVRFNNPAAPVQPDFRWSIGLSF